MKIRYRLQKDFNALVDAILRACDRVKEDFDIDSLDEKGILYIHQIAFSFIGAKGPHNQAITKLCQSQDMADEAFAQALREEIKLLDKQSDFLDWSVIAILLGIITILIALINITLNCA